MEKSKVYFTKEITPENVVKMYEILGVSLPGKVAPETSAKYIRQTIELYL